LVVPDVLETKKRPFGRFLIL